MVNVLRLKQPPTKNKLVELRVGWLVGKLFRRFNWGAVTLPLPWITFILYWVNDLKEVPSPGIRIHEILGHVRQSEILGVPCWWQTYATGFVKHGYHNHPLEVEAYEIAANYETNLPDWAIETS